MKMDIQIVRVDQEIKRSEKRSVVSRNPQPIPQSSTGRTERAKPNASYRHYIAFVAVAAGIGLLFLIGGPGLSGAFAIGVGAGYMVERATRDDRQRLRAYNDQLDIQTLIGRD